MKLKYDKIFFGSKFTLLLLFYFHFESISLPEKSTLFCMQEISYNNFKTSWHGQENCLVLSLGFTVFTKLHKP